MKTAWIYVCTYMPEQDDFLIFAQMIRHNTTNKLVCGCTRVCARARVCMHMRICVCHTNNYTCKIYP